MEGKKTYKTMKKKENKTKSHLAAGREAVPKQHRVEDAKWSALPGTRNEGNVADGDSDTNTLEK